MTVPLLDPLPFSVGSLPVRNERLDLDFDLRAVPKDYVKTPDHKKPGDFRLRLSERCRNYQMTVANRARKQLDAMGRRGFVRPLAVLVVCYFRPPREWSERDQYDAIAGLIAHTRTPDGDNLLKSTLDALTGICWLDDRLIVRKTVEKRYAEIDLVRVSIRPLDLRLIQIEEGKRKRK